MLPKFSSQGAPSNGVEQLDNRMLEGLGFGAQGSGIMRTSATEKSV